MRKWIVFAMMAASILAGCSAHPLQDDVTGHYTATIVQKIRCEARDALNRIVVDKLSKSPHLPARELARLIEHGDVAATELARPRSKYHSYLDKPLRELFAAYALSAVTFRFRFNITEMSDNKFSGSGLWPFSGGTFGATSANAHAMVSRQAERIFLVTNSFWDLEIMPRDKCRNLTAHASNYNFPITGKIGLEEVFNSFITIDHLASFDEPKADDNSASEFTDVLTFTTTVSAGVAPTIDLRNGAPTARSATATSAATRTDEHEVTIGVSRGESLTPAKLATLATIEIDNRRATAAAKSRLNVTRRATDYFFAPLEQSKRDLIKPEVSR